MESSNANLWTTGPPIHLNIRECGLLRLLTWICNNSTNLIAAEFRTISANLIATKFRTISANLIAREFRTISANLIATEFRTNRHFE